MPYGVEGPLDVKEGGYRGKVCREGFLDVFGEPHNLLYAAPSLTEACLADRKYATLF